MERTRIKKDTPAPPAHSPAKPYHPRRTQLVTTVSCPIRYEIGDPPGGVEIKETRRYFVGHLPLAYVQLFNKRQGFRGSSDVVAYLSSGGDKREFSNEAELHEALIAEASAKSA